MIMVCGRQTFGDKGFWAPQFFNLGDKYLYLYTANEQVAVAAGDSIEAVYTQTAVAPLDASEKNIDPYLFRDDDGKYYLYADEVYQDGPTGSIVATVETGRSVTASFPLSHNTADSNLSRKFLVAVKSGRTDGAGKR